MAATQTSEWTTVIKPKSSLLEVDFGELWQYRDLTFIVQLWMYATPVIYPLSTIEDPRLKMLMQANPLTSIMETFKFGMLGVGEFSWAALGVVVFNKIQRTFMDTV